MGIACGGVGGRFQTRTLQNFCRALRERPGPAASWISTTQTHFALHLFLGGLQVQFSFRHTAVDAYLFRASSECPPPHQNRFDNHSVRHHGLNVSLLHASCRHRLTCACFPLGSFFSWRWNVALDLLLSCA